MHHTPKHNHPRRRLRPVELTIGCHHDRQSPGAYDAQPSHSSRSISCR
jgi:hypothetical protein